MSACCARNCWRSGACPASSDAKYASSACTTRGSWAGAATAEFVSRESTGYVMAFLPEWPTSAPKRGPTGSSRYRGCAQAVEQLRESLTLPVGAEQSLPCSASEGAPRRRQGSPPARGARLARWGCFETPPAREQGDAKRLPVRGSISVPGEGRAGESP